MRAKMPGRRRSRYGVRSASGLHPAYARQRIELRGLPTRDLAKIACGPVPVHERALALWCALGGGSRSLGFRASPRRECRDHSDILDLVLEEIPRLNEFGLRSSCECAEADDSLPQVLRPEQPNFATHTKIQSKFAREVSDIVIYFDPNQGSRQPQEGTMTLNSQDAYNRTIRPENSDI
jgi:hypothetical protein